MGEKGEGAEVEINDKRVVHQHRTLTSPLYKNQEKDSYVYTININSLHRHVRWGDRG